MSEKELRAALQPATVQECPNCGRTIVVRLAEGWRAAVDDAGIAIPIVGCGNPWHYVGAEPAAAEPVDGALRRWLDAVSAAEALGWTWADGMKHVKGVHPITGDLYSAHAAAALAATRAPTASAAVPEPTLNVERLREAARIVGMPHDVTVADIEDLAAEYARLSDPPMANGQ